MIDVTVLYIVALVAIVFRIYAQAGYKLTPFYDKETGKFQLNIIGIIIAGFITAIPVINATPLTGDLVYTVLVVFMTVYGVPAVVDKFGTIITPTPTSEAPVAEEKLPEGEA